MKNILSKLLILCFFAVLVSCQTGTSTDKVKTDSEQISLSTVQLKVGGMTCTGCEKAVETGLLNIPGIASVDAVFGDSLAVIDMDTTMVSIEKVKQVIADLGYSVIE